MGIKPKEVAKILGLVVAAVGISMIPALLVSALYMETNVVYSFSACIFAYTIIGSMVHFSIKKDGLNIKLREALLIVPLSWILVSVLGSVPFLLTESVDSVSGAIFESASGFTTTGASVIEDVESLPHGIIFWRSLNQWYGGMGIIMIVSALFSRISKGSHIVAQAEASGTSEDKVTSKLSDTLKIILVTYVSLTLLAILLMIPSEMSVFDSLIHSMSAVSTGGFSNYNDGIMHFKGDYIKWVLSFIMIAGAINYTRYFFLFTKHKKMFFNDKELHWYIGIMLSATLVIGLNLFFSFSDKGLYESAKTAFFQTASTMTTTGFAIENYVGWPSFACIMILGLMFIGGCTASAAGGIKVFRVAIITKLVKRNIERRLHPNAIVSIKVSKEPIDPNYISMLAGFVFTFLTVFFVSVLLLSFENHDMLTTSSAVVSCLSNVGTGFGMVGPQETYAFFSDGGKLFLSILMIAGRIELFSVLLLMSTHFWNPHR